MLVQLQKEALEKVMQVINYAENNYLTCEQSFIDFLDDLNDISVRY